VESAKIVQEVAYALEEQSLRHAIIAMVLKDAVGVMGITSTIQQGSLWNVVDAIKRENVAIAKERASVQLAGEVVRDKFPSSVIAYFLGRMGFITSDMLAQYRRHAIIVIMLLSAIITPPDVMTLILVAIPLYLLYEVSIRVVH